MKTSIKTLQDVGGLADLRTYTGTVRKSAKPALPTTAILELYMRRNERDRLEKELKLLKKRKAQLMERLRNVEKEMNKLLERATEKAIEMRGKVIKTKGGRGRNPTKRKNVILEY